MATVENRTRMIKFAITMLIPAIILLVPVSEIFTHEMKLFIAFTVWMLMWAAFELTDLFVPAIVWPVLMVIFKVLPATTVYSSYLSTVVFACIAGIILGAVLDRIGLLRRISYHILITCGGSFTRTIFALFLACSLMSILTFMGATLIIATMCFGLCKAMNLKPHSKEGVIIMMTGMLAASTIRMFIYCPIHVGLLVGAIQTVDPTFTISVIDLLKYNWPVLIYCVFFIWLMVFINKKSIQQDSATGLEYFKTELAAMGPMTMVEKKATVIVLGTMLAILSNPLHKIDGMIIIMLGTALLFVPGIDVGKQEDTKSVSIGMILFIGSCMAIGAGCNELGLTKILSGALVPVLSQLSPFWILIGIILFGVVMNLPMTPLAMLAALSAPLYAVGTAAGANPMAIAFAFLFSTDMVFLPFQYVVFLIFFSFNMMNNMQFIKYHALKDLLFLVFYVVVIVPWWKLVGLI